MSRVLSQDLACADPRLGVTFDPKELTIAHTFGRKNFASWYDRFPLFRSSGFLELERRTVEYAIRTSDGETLWRYQ